ncbi:hypothetical protein BH18ACT9_BH18ACT9_08200 [soil metagenome]
MGDVTANVTMSLDGYVEDASDSIELLFGWYTSGDRVEVMPGDGREF